MKRILVHGLMAAVPLAIIGYLFAQMAGMWTAAQSPVRIGPLHEETVKARSDDSTAITQTLEVKVPLTLAAGGFVFVMIGELLLSVWRKPSESDGKTQGIFNAESATLAEQKLSGFGHSKTESHIK